MSDSERDAALAEIESLLSKPGGNQALRFLLNTLGSVPLAGGAIAASCSAWGELEQQALDGALLEWAKLADDEINRLKNTIATINAEPTLASMALLIGEIVGDANANALLDGELNEIGVMLNSVTLNELEPYVGAGWLQLTLTGSTMNMGGGNRIGGHIEDQKRPHGIGHGYIIQIQGPQT